MTSRILSSTAWKICSVDLDAGARRRANVELDHAAVDRRIEIAADKDEHHGAEGEHQDGEDRDDGPAGQQHRRAARHSLRAAARSRARTTA